MFIWILLIWRQIQIVYCIMYKIQKQKMTKIIETSKNLNILNEIQNKNHFCHCFMCPVEWNDFWLCKFFHQSFHFLHFFFFDFVEVNSSNRMQNQVDEKRKENEKENINVNKIILKIPIRFSKDKIVLKLIQFVAKI